LCRLRAGEVEVAYHLSLLQPVAEDVVHRAGGIDPLRLTGHRAGHLLIVRGGG